MQGGGLVNSIINNLPFEVHLPGYNYCGPGTKLYKRLARGDRGVNKLDEACMQHDIAYTNHTDLSNRHKADLQLLNMAKQRIKSKDAGKGEKLSSWLVSKVMKAKLKSGSGIKSFKNLVSKIKSKIKKLKRKDSKTLIKAAYLAAKKLLPNVHHRIRLPRVIPIPKTGGVLPLIPIFAGLSALGSLAGGAAGIAKTVNDYKASKQNLQETERHNKAMEALVLGNGLYIKPYKSGKGLFITSSKN